MAEKADLTALEKVVCDFVRDYPRIYRGDSASDALRVRIDAAIVNLVNRGILEVGLNWTLKLKDGR